MNRQSSRLFKSLRNGLPPGGLSLGFFAVVVFAIALAPYLQTAFADFAYYDDDTYILANPNVRQGLTWSAITWAFSSGGYMSTWHPLTWLSLMTDVSLFGVSAGAMHLVNALLHAACAVLLLLFLLRLTGNRGASFLAAALWAAHPLRVESVAWACQRKDVLAAFWGLLAMLAYLKGFGERLSDCRLKAEVGGSPSPATAPIVNDGYQGWLLLATGCFALAFMAKPTVVTFPLLAAAIEFGCLGRVRWRHIELLVWAAICGMIITVYTQGVGGAINPEASFALKVMNALASLGIYTRQMLFPINLACYYPLQWPQLMDVANGIMVGAALAFVFWHTAVSARSRALGGAFGPQGINTASLLPYAAAVCWLAFALGPVIGFVQLGTQAHCDRFTYWPSIGIAIALAWGLTQAQRNRPRLVRPVWLAGGAAILILLAASCRQTAFWHDPETVFRRVLAVTSPDWVPNLDLGLFLCLQHRSDEGVPYLRQAVALSHTPRRHGQAMASLVWALTQAGQIDEANETLARLIADCPVMDYTSFQGMIALRRHATTEAMQLLLGATKRHPDVAKVWWELGNAFAEQKSWPEAIAAWRRTLELDLTLTPVIELLNANAYHVAGHPVPDWQTLIADGSPTNAPFFPAQAPDSGITF